MMISDDSKRQINHEKVNCQPQLVINFDKNKDT